MTAIPPVDFDIRCERLGPALAAAPGLVVAVPVKDEEARITSCLCALGGQVEIDFADLAVILLLNNCHDATAQTVRDLAGDLPFSLELRQVELPAAYANAGWARRLAMEAAVELAREDGLILTTDADTLVEADWIAANLREIKGGADAVAGYVMADPVELMELPPAILERGSLEWEYQQLVAEMVARVDPDPHDPWPRHNQNCGASAAITCATYRRIGGLPPRPVGEDRALFEMVRRVDGRIRHSLDVQVVTSARTDGRALGGLSDASACAASPTTPAMRCWRWPLWPSGGACGADACDDSGTTGAPRAIAKRRLVRKAADQRAGAPARQRSQLFRGSLGRHRGGQPKAHARSGDRAWAEARASPDAAHRGVCQERRLRSRRRLTTALVAPGFV